jgi:hypothetical protein
MNLSKLSLSEPESDRLLLMHRNPWRRRQTPSDDKANRPVCSFKARKARTLRLLCAIARDVIGISPRRRKWASVADRLSRSTRPARLLATSSLIPSYPARFAPAAPAAPIHGRILINLRGFQIFFSQFILQTELLVSLILFWTTN